ncbi:uncharacterized protein LOC113345744 [Papaver somniferum]|uniref:uncharacterized protein LOC113345744 n=1 Tax=Papaver somniferum TaxID=3469 RepID=UPI000E6FE36E|nr:uncharacterized protein LOC113345744 [Papaver somniferum]
MAKALGTPIVVDKRTLAHEYGYYASVLIDINFAEHDSDSIHVTVGGLDFWQKIDIPKKPKFCAKCKIIGHYEADCRKKTKNNTTNIHATIPGKQLHVPRIKNEGSKGTTVGNEWQEARRRKGKTTPSIPVMPEVVSSLPNERKISTVHGQHEIVHGQNAIVVPVNVVLEEGGFVSGSDQVAVDKQLQDELAKSEADVRSAIVELARTKQRVAARSTLVPSATESMPGTKSIENSEAGEIKNSSVDRIVSSLSNTPLSDALFVRESVVSPNQFEALSAELGLLEDAVLESGVEALLSGTGKWSDQVSDTTQTAIPDLNKTGSTGMSGSSSNSKKVSGLDKGGKTLGVIKPGAVRKYMTRISQRVQIPSPKNIVSQ